MSTPYSATQASAPPPPPPLLGETSSGGSRPTHPAWNSLVSDITMSEDEEAHLHRQQHQQQNQQQHYHPYEGHDSDLQHHQEYFQALASNEGSAVSLLEYSQSSDEGYRAQNYNDKTRQRKNGQGELQYASTSSDLLASASSSGFRFRDDMNQSNRVVRFSATAAIHDDPHRHEEVSDIRQIAREAQEELLHGEADKQQLQPSRSQMQPQSTSQKQRHRHKHRRHHQEHHQHQRSGSATINRETFLSTSNEYLTKLASSFRTPPISKEKKKFTVGDEEKSGAGSQQATCGHDTPQANYSVGQSYHVPVKQDKLQLESKEKPGNSENTPLLAMDEDVDASGSFSGQHHHYYGYHIQQGHHKTYPSRIRQRHPYDYASMAVAFLQDYEAARPPTLPSNLNYITSFHMALYSVKYSTPYSFLLGSGTIALFLSSAMEGPTPENSKSHLLTISVLNFYAIGILAIDMWIRSQFLKHPYNYERTKKRQAANTPSRTFNALPIMTGQRTSRTSQANLWMRPLFLFCLFLGLENIGWLVAQPDRSVVVLYSSIFKPIVLYYISRQARHALEALMCIARIVTRVLMIEMLLILSFAAVACRLFQDFDPFDTLSVAWLSLFQLSTTVVNPSIWMPMYEKSHWSAIFFVLFVVVSVFYMHSLVLSVVFQTYIQAATDIHDRSVSDREDALQLAFAALKKQHQEDLRKQNKQQSSLKRSSSSSGIPMYLIREALESLRPHYSVMKINALVEIFNTDNPNDVDFPTFRSKIRRALIASIRTARHVSCLSSTIEWTSVGVSLVNFGYVILLTSSFSQPMFDSIEMELGVLITLVGLGELILRTNPMRLANFTPLTRFNATFDGLATIAALISCVGVGLWITGKDNALEYVLMGRAVDMVRVMRLLPMFKEVVSRSSEVLPALLGPITLVLTALHIFVYSGMALWAGAIVVGELTEDEITPLYDLNNFNSYLEGLVTMFQVLVVNDWHAIAEVFLYANRCCSPGIVYPFFIFGNLVGVSTLLNVITAFFVESFVTKLGGTDVAEEGGHKSSSNNGFSIRTSENYSVRKIASTQNLARLIDAGDDDSNAHDADSEGSSDSSELFEFDVYEREGYDSIIQTVSGGMQQDDYARQACNNFEVFESLSPGRERVGYLVCCQQTMNRYGNKRFESDSVDFLGKMELHSLVSDMHAELLALVLSSNGLRDRSLVRTYPHKTDPSKMLEICATILRRQPALSLFVSRIVKASPAHQTGG